MYSVIVYSVIVYSVIVSGQDTATVLAIQAAVSLDEPDAIACHGGLQIVSCSFGQTGHFGLAASP